jgi:hypothetical protein
MKLNLKNVQALFRKGVFLNPNKASKFPAAVATVTLYVIDERYEHQHISMGTIDRDKFLDLAPRELKRVIHNMRNRATALDPNRDNWMIETQCCGDYYTRTLRVN